MSDREMWREIEREARAKALDEEQPLEFGSHVAWVNCMKGSTEGLSPLHRVGQPIGNNPYTSCGELIPHPIRRFPLNWALIRSMPRCKFCETELARSARESAA